MKDAMKRMELFPLFCVSSTLNYGTRAVLSTIVELMPSAYEMEELHALVGSEGDETVEIHAKDDAPFTALVFKTAAEPHVHGAGGGSEDEAVARCSGGKRMSGNCVVTGTPLLRSTDEATVLYLGFGGGITAGAVCTEGASTIGVQPACRRGRGAPGRRKFRTERIV